MKHFISMIVMLFCIQLSAQDGPVDQLGNYIKNTLPEKVYVHTDKDVYAAGENLWCAVYLLNGVTHIPGTFSEVVYIEFRDSEETILHKRKVYAPDGHAAVDFRLEGDLYPGTYEIIAYTNYQLNSPNQFVFKKQITIIDGLEPVEIVLNKERSLKSLKFHKKEKFKFFPEGGDCINGVPCQVSVVAEDKLTALGSIKDSQGKEVGKLNLKEGIGRFIYLPTKGDEYTLEVNRLEHPVTTKALDGGLHLSVKKQKENLRITVSTNSENSVNGTRVVVHIRGDAILNQIIEKEESRAVLFLPFNQLPAGINTITVFNDSNDPMAERLYYVPIQKDTDLKMNLKKEALGRRKNVDVTFAAPLNPEFKDSLNISRISYSVLPEKIFANTSSFDIRTWVLLNSDLDEHIHLDPDLLFGDSPEATLRKIDDFLLTRAWRKFTWMSEEGQSEYAPKHPLELGLYIQGNLNKFESSKARQPGKVFALNLQTGDSQESVTDDNGNFVFGPYLSYDTSTVLIQGRYSKKKDDNRATITLDDKPYVDIKISQKSSPTLELAPPLNMTAKPIINIESYKEISDTYLDVAQSYDSLSITLDEVVLTSTFKTKIQKEREDRSATLGFSNPNRRIVVDSVSGFMPGSSLIDLLRRLPGYTLTGTTGNFQLTGRKNNSIMGGTSSPLLLLDGFATDMNLLEIYQAEDIDFIDVVNGLRAANRFGTEANGGAIMVYTRIGARLSKRSAIGIMHTEIYGFYKAREFATFDPNGIGNQTRPDIRTTLYWNPDIRTDIKGGAEDSFTTSDQDGMYIIFAQGMRSDGIPISGIAKFEVDGSLQ